MAAFSANKARKLFLAGGKIHLYQALRRGGAPTDCFTTFATVSSFTAHRHLTVSMHGLSLLSCDFGSSVACGVQPSIRTSPRTLALRIVASRLCRVLWEA